MKRTGSQSDNKLKVQAKSTFLPSDSYPAHFFSRSSLPAFSVLYQFQLTVG